MTYRKVKLVTYAAHYISWFLFFPYFNARYRVSTSVPETFLKLKKPLIVASNHISIADPWRLQFTLPFRYFRIIAPFAPFAAQTFRGSTLNFFYRIGIVKFIYWIYDVVLLPPRGTFAYSTEEKLRGAIEALGYSRSLLIFPEGHILKGGTLGEFKTGVVMLQEKTGLPLLPVTIVKERNGLRPRVRVVWHKPFVRTSGETDKKALERLRAIIDGPLCPKPRSLQ